ncbi:alpha/beta fold hydrolase [Novosphingobium sp. FSY-8]|uniref:Alpha/beta fold hydrolase n=1 Tax=Novosphingobium ovatum TaxID=1908523 RepID=A0ABW9X904_9SPHN|nr:alpha/beta hydrolase [Novosphingobium ovatum]NBC35000.1 alpha/beta fold hydrolase [Novosphingobium ovatum]
MTQTQQDGPRAGGLRRVINGLAWGVGGVVVAGAAIIGTQRAGLWNPSYDAVMAKHFTPPSKFVMVGDVKLHVRDEGPADAPVVLMLHSSMSNLRIWDGWADQFKGKYRVIRLDWPPYGLSVDPHPAQGMPGVIALLEKFVAQEKLPPFVIVASSSGATIATLYTARHPDQVRALALSTLPLRAPPPTPMPPVVAGLFWLHENVVPNYQARYFYQHSLASLYGRPERLTPETVDWYYETNNIPGGFARVKAYYTANTKGVWKTGADKQAAAVHVPILLQWGDRDIVLPVDRADEARKMFANAPMQIIHYPDVGHYPMLELPKETGADLVKFIDALPAPKP